MKNIEEPDYFLRIRPSWFWRDYRESRIIKNEKIKAVFCVCATEQRVTPEPGRETGWRGTKCLIVFSFEMFFIDNVKIIQTECVVEDIYCIKSIVNVIWMASGLMRINNITWELTSRKEKLFQDQSFQYLEVEQRRQS